MTDYLRDRIAAAIYNSSDDYSRKLMVRPDCPGASELEGDGKPICYAWADAVIAALGLRDDVDCSDDGKTYLHRYCTEWRPTEITDDLRRRFLQQMTQDAADDDAYEQFNGFVDTREETSD